MPLYLASPAIVSQVIETAVSGDLAHTTQQYHTKTQDNGTSLACPSWNSLHGHAYEEGVPLLFVLPTLIASVLSIAAVPKLMH